MDRILHWISLALGLLAVIPSFASQLRRQSRSSLSPGLVLIALVPVLAAAGLSLLSQPPFSSGQTLWAGLLLGAGGTLLGALASGAEPRSERSRHTYVAWSARFGAAAAGVAVLLILYAARILDVLSGYALGALTFGILLSGMLALTDPSSADSAARRAGIEATALVVSTVAAATYLATFHQSATGIREWQPLPGLLTAAMALLFAVRGAVSGSAERHWLLGLGVVGVPLGIVAGILATQLNGSLPFLWTVLLGFGLFGLMAGIEEARHQSVAERASRNQGTESSIRLLVSLLVIGGGVVAFRMLHGFGLALLVLAGCAAGAAFSNPHQNAARSNLLPSALGLGLVVALYRLFVERNEYNRGFQPDFLYYYAALLVGALLPGLLASLATGWLPDTDRATTTGDPLPVRRPWGSASIRMGLAVSLAILSPLAVWLLIGDRPEAALLVGLAVAYLGAMGITPEDELPGASSLQRLLAPTIALSATQFTHLLQPLALRTRSQRLELLAAITVAVLLGIVLTAWLERSGRRTASTVR